LSRENQGLIGEFQLTKLLNEKIMAYRIHRSCGALLHYSVF